uniref:CHAT domain-containing protein n=1 Tax=Psilocybe cubensis TaxID=181762 RepID=A0A8H8CG05_PSICU
MQLNNLAALLYSRFERSGQKSDLDKTICMYRRALELLPSHHPDRSTTLYNLAGSLKIRSNRVGQKCDLDEAIYLHRQALELLPSPHPYRSASLDNLAGALLTKFEYSGQQSDLDEAISMQREILELLPSAHPNRPASFNNLACALWTRFEQGGKKRDLDEAISMHRKALELRPLPHSERSASLSNLASVLWTRFEKDGQKSDLDEAILMHKCALELRPTPHPDQYASLNNLAGALLTRFNHYHQKCDLNDAILMHRTALELCPSPHPDRSTSLNNLACALRTRFNEGGQNDDLDTSIDMYRETLALRPFPHPNRSTSLNNLASALTTQYDRQRRESDFNEAMSMHREALELRASPHPDRSASLTNLAILLYIYFEEKGRRQDFEHAILLLSTAAQYRFQPPSTSFFICKMWISYAKKHCHASLITAFGVALQVLRPVAALSLTVELRRNALLSGTDGLARDASNCAVLAGDLSKAIEFLEAGRSIFWAQALALRSPFDQLRSSGSESSAFADRLQFIARELEMGSQRNISAPLMDNYTRLSIDEESSRLNRLSEEWEEILVKVRKLQGYENFLLPPHLSTLQAAAYKEPIALLISNPQESHCLILTSKHIHHIPLPRLPNYVLEVLIQTLQMAFTSSTNRSVVEKSYRVITSIFGTGRGISYQERSDSDSIFRFILSILWEEIVKPIINYLDIKNSRKPSTLYWCPTGYFTFLPMHAAGIYSNCNSAIDCASEYIISSYTPTIGILLAESSPPTSRTFKMMAIIQSQDLPSTNSELQNIREHVPDCALISMGTPGSPANVETVVSRLSDVSIAHFACHGYQDPLNPLNSWLKLNDGQLSISRIMKEKVSHGALAFLSACETATGDVQLPDEAMSIAASLLFCGFRRVVATMWMMRDEDGPTVAGAFYRELFRGPGGEKIHIPDVTKSAYALHIAVTELRAQTVSFRRWGDMPKEWELTDEFEEAPKKPEGDPWKVILDPLIAKENIRCNAWKDEVQNLLIFAGLFSAVITAFVVESYKNLQRDSNADMILLLSHIATRLDSPGNFSTMSFSLPSSFSPDPSAVRVNAFWFLSLILSLATVLVGIISLQWLREYQSFPGRSARDILAIYRMRAEGIEKWHVSKIFTVLPLLLQAALVLFFAGILDFLHALGNNTVLVIAAIAVGVTLLFLLVTTFMPAYQNLALQLWFLVSKRKHRPPSQCPYKSPQSAAFVAGFFAILQTWRFLLSHLVGSSCFNQSWSSKTKKARLVQYLSCTWSMDSWIDSDMTWLSVRDVCQELYLSQDEDINVDYAETHSPLPLFDITQMLRKSIGDGTVTHTEELLSTAYHCFNDLSRAFLRRDQSLKENTDEEIHRRFEQVVQRNRYFHTLICKPGNANEHLFCPPNPQYFIDFERIHYLATFDVNNDILHHQNLFMFVDHIIKNYSRTLVNHRAELMIRLAKALYQKHTVLLPDVISNPKGPPKLPGYLRGDIGLFDHLNYAQQGNKVSEFKMFFPQYSFMLIEFFEHAAKSHGQHPGHTVCLHGHESTVKFLETASVHAYIAIAPYIDATDTQDRTKRIKAMSLVLKSISTSLGRSVLFDSQQETLYLFYTAAIFIRCFYCLMLSQDSQDPGYNRLLTSIRDLSNVLLAYKKKTLDVGIIEPHLHDQFKGRDMFYYKASFKQQSERFCPQWWAFLDGRTSNCRVPLSVKLQVAMAGRLHRPKFKMGKLVNTFAETTTGLGVNTNNPVSLLRALVSSSAGTLRARLRDKPMVPIDESAGRYGDARVADEDAHTVIASKIPDQNEEGTTHQHGPYSRNGNTIPFANETKIQMNPNAHDFV